MPAEANLADTNLSATMPPQKMPAVPRVRSIDAYRGLVMFLMLGEVLALSRVAREVARTNAANGLPSSPFWDFLAFHQSHVEWTGCSLHDMIQPSFSFLVGVALPFSLAARKAKGDSNTWMTLHALFRAFILIFLGVFLRSIGARQTNFTFIDTLSQIGMGYFFLYLLGRTSELWQWLAAAVIVVGMWGAYVAFPAPGPDFDYPAVGVPKDYPHLHEHGWLSHFNKNANLGAHVDTVVLNWFRPEDRPYELRASGGYATLNFVCTLATMLLGVIAGGWMLKPGNAWLRVFKLAAVGGVLLGLGLAAEHFEICPIVKKIWTPSWVLFSGGICMLMLAGFHAVIEGTGFWYWSFPLMVIGANSIFIYCVGPRLRDFIIGSFQTHFGQDVFKYCGAEYETLLSGAAVLAVLWLMLLWMYHKRAFVKI